MEENRRKFEEARIQQQRDLEQQQAASRARFEEQQRQMEEQRLQREAADRQRREEAERENQRRREEMERAQQQAVAAGPTFTPPPTPSMPNMPSPSIPRFEDVYVCEQCNHDISKTEALGSKCPYCGTVWDSKPPELPPPVASSSSWSSGNTRISGRAIKGLFGLAVLVIGGFVGAIRWLTGSGDSGDSYSQTPSTYYPPSPSTPPPSDNPFSNQNPFN